MARLTALVLFVLLAPACHAWQVSTSSTRRCELRQLSTASGREALPVLWPRGPARSREVLLDAASTDGGGASEPTSAKDSPPEADGAAEPAVVVDVVAREALDVIVKEELAVLAGQTPEEQETQLPTLLARVEARAADASEAKGYRFGDISQAVVESTRGEVRRRRAPMKPSPGPSLAPSPAPAPAPAQP